MATVAEEYKKIQTSGKRPIAGQSLASDPENPDSYEKAPEFTSIHTATEYIFGKFIEPETYTVLMTAISEGTAIMDIVQSILFAEFQEGKFNPDLLLMLIEPVSYMLIALAERLDLDISIYRGELEDEDKEQQVLGVAFSEERLKKLQKAAQSGRVPANTITPVMAQKIEDLPEIPALQSEQESLLVAPTETPVINKQSFMSPPTGS